MEKIALIEINVNHISMSLADVNKNKSYTVYDNIVMPINLGADIETNEIIKPNMSESAVQILTIFKEMCEAKGIADVIAVGNSALKKAKNHEGFVNEIFTATGFKLNIIPENEEINYIYTSVINTFNRPKGLIINVSTMSTQILHYNRRNVLNVTVLPFGSVNATEYLDREGLEQKDLYNLICDKLKDVDYIRNLEEEFDVVLTGNVALNVSSLARRAKRYPLAVDHNMVVNNTEFEKIYSALNTAGVSKNSKIKGVSLIDSPNLLSGMTILKAILDQVNKNEFCVSQYSLKEGLLLNYALPITLEKPISDNLGYSLQELNEHYNRPDNNAEHVYNLSMLLFKQLKVLHKLNRMYVKVLRVASYLYDSGKRISGVNVEKNAFEVIINSEIYGVSHRDLVLAGFTAMMTDPDNFNLADWVKYKDIVSEDDLVAVKKLAVILKLACDLDCTGFGRILDINCDILGDSVIMKTITETPVVLEIKAGMLNANEFKKAFGKNLEIL